MLDTQFATVEGAAFTSDGTRVVLARTPGEALVYDTRHGDIVATHRDTDAASLELRCLTISDDGFDVLMGTEDATYRETWRKTTAFDASAELRIHGPACGEFHQL